MQELFDACMGQTSGVELRTVSDARSAFGNHVLSYFGTTDVRLLRNKVRPRRPAPIGPDGQPMSITAWVNWLSTRSGLDRTGAPTGTALRPKTIRNLHALLSQVLQFAVDDDEDDPLLPRNPCVGTKLPAVQQQERPFLEHAHFLALHAAIDAWFRPLLVFLVATGVRWGEAAGLRVRHMHLDPGHGPPYVEIMIAWRRGSGGTMVLGRVKSAASQRRVSLSPRSVEAIRPLLAGNGPDEAVFTMRGGGPLHHGNFTSRWLVPAVAACAEHGVDQRLRAHGFRHTHAAWLLSAGRPVTSVQKRLGHENARTTTKIYGHHPGSDEGQDRRRLRLELEVRPGAVLALRSRMLTRTSCARCDGRAAAIPSC